MNTQEETNFERIEAAINYISRNFKTQPDLDEIAESVHLSPFHFQRLFTEWAGVSPKKFLQYLTVEHAKSILRDKQYSLFDTAYDSGLSGTGRLHDLFVHIEGITPGEFKTGGNLLLINYSFAQTPFGQVLVASTAIGICYMAFAEDTLTAFQQLEKRFPNAVFKQLTDTIQQNALHIFGQDWSHLKQIKLHLKGTPFQLKVWETLLKIPSGQLTTYGQIAAGVGAAGSSRAVGTAIGMNPVAFLIPCHRVIQSSGAFGQYHWGADRKSAMIGWESALAEKERQNILPYDGEVFYYGSQFSIADAQSFFAILLEDIEWQPDEAIIFGKHIYTKRKAAWYGDKAFQYTYSKTTKIAKAWTPALLVLKHHVEAQTGQKFNSCLLNLYHDGQEGMAWHSDDEKSLGKDTCIASLSFGAIRKFAFKHKTTGEYVYLMLESGSLLVMQGTTQTHWLHRLPPTVKVKTPRINLTFRTMLDQG